MIFKRQRQFGKAISDFQAIRWKLADMATEIDAAWLLTLWVASMKDGGMKTTQESSMAKLCTSEVTRCRCANRGRLEIFRQVWVYQRLSCGGSFITDVKLCRSAKKCKAEIPLKLVIGGSC